MAALQFHVGDVAVRGGGAQCLLSMASGPAPESQFLILVVFKFFAIVSISLISALVFAFFLVVLTVSIELSISFFQKK